MTNIPEHVRRFYRTEENDMGEDELPDRKETGHLATAFHVAVCRIEAARSGDARARKEVMFPFRYGQKRDVETGTWRAYTAEELAEIEQRLLGT